MTKSVADHKRDGTYRKCRHDQKDKPGENYTMNCPKELTGEAKNHWNEVVPQLLKLGIIQPIDESCLMAMCESWAVYRKVFPHYYNDPLNKDIVGACKTSLGNWNYYMTKFGMNPVDRAKVVVHATPEAEEVIDDFEALLQTAGGDG